MKTFKEFLEEDAPVNNVGGGAIAGVGIGPQGQPPVRKTKYKQSNEKAGRSLLMHLRDIGVK